MPRTTGAETRINDPSIPARNKESKTTAADVHYFFEKDSSLGKTVCKVCKVAREASPSDWPTHTRIEYSTRTSTTSLRQHIKKHHFDLYSTLADARGWNTSLVLKGQSQTSDSVTLASAQDEQREVFDQNKFHQRLVDFIVADDQAINIVECPEFRELLLLLRSDLKDSMIPHRTKVRGLVIETWGRYFQVLKDDLANAMGQVSFTTDIWSDRNRRSFLAITAHWIAPVDRTSSFKLRVALIAFQRLRGQHTGVLLAGTVLALLDRAGVTRKVGHFTLDGASNNGTMLEGLAGLLEARDIPFDARDRRIMCYGHIVDLSSGRVVQGLTKAGISQEQQDENGSILDPVFPAYEEAIARDPIALARAVVRAIRSSGTRRDAFDDIIKFGNDEMWFKDGEKVVRLDRLQLLRDVRTRWDSIYKMLNRLRELRPAVDYFLALPNNHDLAKYKISPQEWQAMQDVEVILSIPHKVQQVMSGESNPILSGAIPAFETFMSAWEKFSQGNPHLQHIVQPGLDWAYQYYAKMDRTRAYVVAMFLNPSIRMSWFNKHWDERYVTDARSKIQKTMLEYREKAALCSIPSGLNANTGHSEIPAYMSLAVQYGLSEEMDLGVSDASEPTIEHEYQAYITAPVSPKTMNILKFWEVNGSSFPTLFAIAMDYLPIQASAVPCERVFSSSAETDTKRRNRISPITMEALQMFKYHYKKERLNFTEAWACAEKDMIEDDPDRDVLGGLLRGDPQKGLDDAINYINQCEE